VETSLLEWWWLISKKRCDDYAHLQEYDYNVDLKALEQSRGGIEEPWAPYIGIIPGSIVLFM
jgi:hypothetical protein